MADINFTNFHFKTNLSLDDFVVGYDENGLNEIKTKISNFSNKVLESENLLFDEISKNLSISNGKTVSLSGLNLAKIKEDVFSSETYRILQASDNQSLLIFDNIYPTIVTIPDDSYSHFPIGSEIRITRKGSGNVSLSASYGVTIKSENSSLF